MSYLYISHPHLVPELERIEAEAKRAGAVEAIRFAQKMARMKALTTDRENAADWNLFVALLDDEICRYEQKGEEGES